MESIRITTESSWIEFELELLETIAFLNLLEFITGFINFLCRFNVKIYNFRPYKMYFTNVGYVFKNKKIVEWHFTEMGRKKTSSTTWWVPHNVCLRIFLFFFPLAWVWRQRSSAEIYLFIFLSHPISRGHLSDKGTATGYASTMLRATMLLALIKTDLEIAITISFILYKRFP